MTRANQIHSTLETIEALKGEIVAQDHALAAAAAALAAHGKGVVLAVEAEALDAISSAARVLDARSLALAAYPRC